MSESAGAIDNAQRRWARDRHPDNKGYFGTVTENLFQPLHRLTEAEFLDGDGSELKDGRSRPAKMRALSSSSALAVNFFDAWRTSEEDTLAAALELPGRVSNLAFEYKPRGYPVRPRSPNLDLLLRLENGDTVGVESKFSEPFRSDDGHGVLSNRYFPVGTHLWEVADLQGAQTLAESLRPQWVHLDGAQLLKHMLGLAWESENPTTLLYLWYDTGLPDAEAHRCEIESFSQAVNGGRVTFRAATYQGAFERLRGSPVPSARWLEYVGSRYFGA